jgi:hypothetical protein
MQSGYSGLAVHLLGKIAAKIVLPSILGLADFSFDGSSEPPRHVGQGYG